MMATARWWFLGPVCIEPAVHTAPGAQTHKDILDKELTVALGAESSCHINRKAGPQSHIDKHDGFNLTPVVE